MNLLSTANRPLLLRKMSETEFDLLVVGGGVTGAGIALDAAARGMKVALVEKGDFASGTSSKSTKLIHGGLRYLKQLEISLVREVGRERATLHRLAPHLVKGEKMLLPIVRGGTFGWLATSLGLLAYDFLANVRGDDRRRMLSKTETLQREPLLRPQDLLGGGVYAEYRTDDARLTLEIVKTAVRHGALCLNYAEVEDLIKNKDRVCGARCREALTGERFDISATHVVSAAGSWVDDLRKRDSSLQGKRLFLSKGVHLVVARERLPLRQAAYFDVPDGRMLFAIPRHRAAYVGTTDTPFHGDPNHVFAEKEDVAYLLRGANAMFPGVNLTDKDVESTWAGLRPLIFEEGKSAGEMSRRDEIFISESGLISIAGGKLTGYRKMAERVVNLVCEKIRRAEGRHFEPCRTDSIPLAEQPFADAAEVALFQKNLAALAAPLALPAHSAACLTENYGRAAEGILKNALASGGRGEAALVKSELAFCLENEMVVKPEDFFERRTGRALFDAPGLQGLDVAQLVFPKS